jgi:hypothetical protein
MSAAPETAVLPLGGMQIYDSFVPALPDGTYQVTVEQTVSAAPPGAVPMHTESFAVRGTRWVLNPAEVHAHYPPPHASGRFARTLPNLVLTQRALPWERRLRGAPEGSPWMALLVLDPGELLGEPGDGGLYARSGTVAQLLEDGAAVRAPVVHGTTDAERTLECRWIEITPGAVRAALPRLDELPWLAHCRRVNTEDKPALALRDEGWFSVAMAARFPAAPAAGARSAPAIVHLVSLEGIEELLREDAVLPRAADGSEKGVRMVSLFSWSFETAGEPGSSFGELARGLAGPGEADPGALMLRRAFPAPPPDDARPAAARAAEARLREGYAALEYQARTGDRAFAWYRGPLAPVLPARLERDTPFGSAAAATVWDPTTATFDHSLSAAWSVGRAMALADADFALRMLSLHRRAHALADRLLARLQSAPAPVRIGDVLEPLPAGHRLARVLDQDSTRSGTPPATDTPPAFPAAADRPAPAQALRDLLAREDVRQAIREHAGPDLQAAARWLGRLCLLEGVPFPHLVPEPAVLPPESLRFFYLDRNWIEAAVDGALSVGAATGRDRMVSDALYVDVRDAALREAAAVRGGGPAAGGDPSPTFPPHCAGLLLRSALVSGWPGLSVRGLAGGAPLPVLRMERLSGSVLLCLWAGVPDRVELAEPQQGLRFGVGDDGRVQFRSVAAPVGSQLPGSLDLATPGALRAQRTLDLRPGTGTGLLAALAAGLGLTAPTAAHPRPSPAELAVQMLQAAARLSFPASIA